MIGYRTVKPWIDRLVALLVLIIVAPVVGLILLLLLVVTKKSPIFIQPRVGYREQIFCLYKIKTMYPEELYSKKPWIRYFCRWLRQYSLDEAPQLWNVLRGEMSLIGPRPLLVEYLPLYSEDQRKRHYVKPGMSGWAQLHGRNLLAWPERFALDVWYVEHQSLVLDAAIVGLTLRHLIQPTGVRPEGMPDAEKFAGNEV